MMEQKRSEALEKLEQAIIEMSTAFDELGLEPTTLCDMTGAEIKNHWVKKLLSLMEVLK